MCVHTHGCIINSMQFYHMYVHITTTTVKIQNCFMITRTIPAPCWHSCSSSLSISRTPAAAAAKSLQSCPTLCDPIDLPGSPVPGILQARTLEWIAISFSNAWKWKVKVNSLSRVRLLATPWTAAHQAPQSMGFSRQEYLAKINLCSISIILLLKIFNINCYMSYKMLCKCNILSLTFSTQHNLRSIQVVGCINSSFLLSLILFIYVQNN